MSSFWNCLHRLPVLLVILNLIIPFAHATPTPYALQHSPLSDDLSPRSQPLENAAIALISHPKRAVTHGTFFRGLWSLALTTTVFLAHGPSSTINPASDIESFAQKILAQVARRVALASAQKTAFGWAMGGVSITFTSWVDPETQITPSVPWEVVQEFVTTFVLWRAQRGTVMAFSGNIWGPSGQCVKIVLDVAGATRVGGVANSILDSASEIHGSG